MPSLRQQLRARRRRLTRQQQLDAAEKLGRRLGTQARFQRSQRIGGYLANDGEIDPLEYLHRQLKLGKQVYMPVVPEGLQPLTGHLLFQRYMGTKGKLAINRFGILEPAYSPKHLIHPMWLDMVLVPLVGYDRAGHRLGMGGGYYDKTLARLTWRKPLLVGLAHTCQETELIPEAWDIPMDVIVTERETLWIN